jgi:hypothetical protein
MKPYYLSRKNAVGAHNNLITLSGNEVAEAGRRLSSTEVRGRDGARPVSTDPVIARHEAIHTGNVPDCFTAFAMTLSVETGRAPSLPTPPNPSLCSTAFTSLNS